MGTIKCFFCFYVVVFFTTTNKITDLKKQILNNSMNYLELLGPPFKTFTPVEDSNKFD